jgi:hypothetical protein
MNKAKGSKRKLGVGLGHSDRVKGVSTAIGVLYVGLVISGLGSLT